MQEIEVKARVRDITALKAAFLKCGIKLNDAVEQHDTIYIKGDWEFVKFQKERNILRIRKQSGQALLTLKRPGISELHSLEHETAIANHEEMHKILILMGYKPIVIVIKRRQKSQFQGVEICLDEVESLGWYIELEKLTEDGTQIEEVQKQLFAFLENMGIATEDRETRGYDTLVRLKQEQGITG